MLARGLRTVFYFAAAAVLSAGCAQNQSTEDRPQYMTKSERDEYIPSFQKNCVAAQRSDALGKHLSDAQRGQYCSCAASRSAETVTLEQLGTLIRTGSNASLMPHYRDISRYCMERLLPVWLPGLNVSSQSIEGPFGGIDNDILRLLKEKNMQK